MTNDARIICLQGELAVSGSVGSKTTNPSTAFRLPTPGGVLVGGIVQAVSQCPSLGLCDVGGNSRITAVQQVYNLWPSTNVRMDVRNDELPIYGEWTCKMDKLDRTYGHIQVGKVYECLCRMSPGTESDSMRQNASRHAMHS